MKSLDKALEALLRDILDITRTIIIFTGDHGEQVVKSIFDKLMKRIIIKIYNCFSKFGLYENQRLTVYRKYGIGHGSNISETLVNVPLLFVDKNKVPENAKIDAQISHVDIFPTLLSFLEIKKLNMKIDGQTFLPYIERRETNPEHVAYMQASGIVLPEKSKWLEGIRYKGLKYIRYQKDANLGEWLYNIKNDPEERKNIKDESLFKLMRAKLDEIKKGTLRYDRIM